MLEDPAPEKPIVKHFINEIPEVSNSEQLLI